MEEIKLYEGKETLFFEPIKHQYFWNDELLPSATTITKLLTPVQPLIMWANKMASEEFKRLIVAGQKYDEVQLAEFYTLIKNASNKSMTSAGIVGTEVHNLIEDYIHKGIAPEIHNPEIKKSFGKFKEWFDAQEGLEIVFTERKVLSRIHKFTGTLDAIFKTKSGEHIIYDWKSSSGIRDSMLVQIYLYKICIKEELGIDVKKGIIVNCTKEGKLNIKEFPINEMQEQVAISCLNMYRYLNQKGEK
jgi:CRISPR/Cas system-associated exonuclease Cas4 (RecB family)